MLYRISYGPPDARLTEASENIALAAARYCELADANASDIELLMEGMPLDPQLLLAACPANASRFLLSRSKRAS